MKIEEIPMTQLIRKSYDENGVKYSIYEGNNRFYGTPVPEGYEVEYIDDGIYPSSLQLSVKKE